MFQQFCYFCGEQLGTEKALKVNEILVVHERCHLKKEKERYEITLERVREYGTVLQVFRDCFDESINKIEGVIENPTRENREVFYDEWGKANSSKMDMMVDWSLAHFPAHQNATMKLVDLLQNRPSVGELPSVSQKWDEKWLALSTVFLDYSLLLIPHSGFAPKSKSFTGVKTAKAAKKKMNSLIDEVKKLTDQVIAQAEKDVINFSRDYRKEYYEWQRENISRLSMYGII